MTWIEGKARSWLDLNVRLSVAGFYRLTNSLTITIFGELPCATAESRCSYADTFPSTNINVRIRPLTSRLPDNPAICKIAFPGWSRIWRHTVTHLLLFDLVMLSSAHAHIPRSLQFGRCFRQRNDRFENSLPTSTNRTNNREFYLIFHRDNSSISTSKAKKEEKRKKKDNDNNVFAEISQTIHEIFVLRRSHLHQRSWNFHGEK